MRKHLVLFVSAIAVCGSASAADTAVITRTLTAVSAGSVSSDQSLERITVEANSINRPIALANDALRAAPVKYPLEALKRGREGRVVLDFYVDANGLVRESVVRTSSGSDRLDGAAMQAARQWRFTPEMKNGSTVPARALMPVDFRIALAD